MVGYYVLRGVGLLTLPALMSPHVAPSTWVFIIVFGWVFASHQIGAAAARLCAIAGLRSYAIRRLPTPTTTPEQVPVS